MRKLMFAVMALGVLSANAEGAERITVDGQSRNMIVHVPTDLPQNAPLVITLHGFNQSADYQRSTTRWDQVADTAKFVVVYPDAINSWWDVYGTGDLHFIEKIIDNMTDRYHIDPNRVYVSGFSLGAMMTYHCAEHLSDKIAAFGPVSGVRFDNRAPASKRPVPIIHTHGTADDVFKWEGDPGHQAGGYPAITEYVKRWVDYEGLNPVPTVTQRKSNATYTLYRDDNTTTEIALLAVKDCGHWHSEGSDWGGVSTCQEIWNFVKRYSLGDAIVVPPVLERIEPEDHSFDLPLTQTFELTLDKAADANRAKAVLVGNGVTVPLTASTGDQPNKLVLALANGAGLSEGEYKLNVTDIVDPNGGRERNYTFVYTFGVENVGLQMNVDTVFSDKWYDMRASVGEGIPYGWKRVNSRSNGENDTKTSGTPNTGGARLKYFERGGEFDAGFYLSARDYDKCELTYGLTSGYLLKLPMGHYDFSFRSAYWNEGSERADARYNVLLASRAAGAVNLIEGDGLQSTGCLSENTGQRVVGSQLHKYDFVIDKSIMAQMVFSMQSGWNAVIIGDVLLTTHATDADRYKGGLLRLCHEAEELLSEMEANDQKNAAWAALQSCLSECQQVVSTAPSVYQAAIDRLSQCILQARLSQTAGIASIDATNDIVATEYYGVDGRKVNGDYRGIAIKRTIHADGSVSTNKVTLK